MINVLFFSAGRRNCLGERLARAELFLFISNIFRNLHIRLPQGHSLSAEIEVNQGMTRCPKPFQIRFVPRERGAQVENVVGNESSRFAATA